ncbi:methyltransferase domain-containing protein [Patescibacteria group bacterium AH-259-L05]|nr:methyltransferase domain-containing protein [Patescibacteria group bacterium AH-259-L05]
MFLDDVIRYVRVRKVKKYVPKGGILLDIGCGKDTYFLNIIKHKIKKGIGIDQAIQKQSYDNLKFIPLTLKKSLPFPDESVDCISMLAVLEHVVHPKAILQECFRVLKTSGTLLLTTPLPPAKPVLEFLAYTTKVIDRDEIDDHKNYFSLLQTKNMLTKTGFKIVRAKTFELGCNSFIMAQKS